MLQTGKLCSTVAILIVVALATQVDGTKSEIKTKVIDVLAAVMNKLDAVAFGKADAKNPLTYDELEYALRLYEKCSPNFKKQIRKDWQLRLVVDFAVNPLSHLETLADDPIYFALHMIRVEREYKRFMPAYQGEQIGDQTYRIKTTNTQKLWEILSSANPEAEMKDFERAKMEANNWRLRLEELTTNEDIFANLDELQSILNYFNFLVYKPFYDHIFPNLDQFKDAKEVLDLYYKMLWENHGIKFINGVPTVMRAGRRQAARAGFTQIVTA